MSNKGFRITILSISIGLFIFSLTQKCYCTTSMCGDSIVVFISGALGFACGGAAMTWIANPILLTSWMLFKRKPKLSLITSLLASAISLSFLFFDQVIADEAGHYEKITGYKQGYWLWVASSIVIVMGNLALKYMKPIDEKKTLTNTEK